jgi:serine/threonine-protein kinase RsbW
MAALSLTLANRMEEVPRLIALLDAFGQEAQLSDDVVFRMTVALDEVVTNIVRHAFDSQGGHSILLGITTDDGFVTAVVEDDGPPFDLRTVPPADIHAPIELRPIGGLGVHLVRKLAHGLEYRRDGARNILTLTFSATG